MTGSGEEFALLAAQLAQALLSLVLCNSVPSSLVFLLGNTTAARARKGESR
jgi:hypothetical protein